LLGMSLSSCCRFNPASVNCRVSQFATFHAAFASTEASSANWGFRFSRPNLHLLSLRPDDLLTILEDGFVDRFRKFGFSPLRYPSYKVLTFTLVGLSPTEHTSFSWTHFRTAGFPQYGCKAGLSEGAFPARRPIVAPLWFASLLRAPRFQTCSSPLGVGAVVRLSAAIRATVVALPQGSSLRSGLFCPGPSTLNRPHPPQGRAHLDFAALRFIRDALAVHVPLCLGDPPLVLSFR